MKKVSFRIIFLIFCLVLLGNNSLAQEDKRYVRKQVQPNFFIPSGDLAQNRQEKVIIPRYGKGQTTAKRISVEDSFVPAPSNTSKPQSTKNEEIIENSVANDIPEYTQIPEKIPTNNVTTQDSGTPDYQKMYQNYLNDLESIASTGSVSNDTPLNDLSEMNSETRINIDRKFNEKRNIDKEIDNAIKRK